MAARGLCGECKRVVALREHNTLLRIHRVAEETPLICGGTVPLYGEVFDVEPDDVTVIRKSEIHRLQERIDSARIVNRHLEDRIADLEAENKVLRSTNSRADRDHYEAAVDTVLNSGKLNMRQLQVFWEVAREQSPLDLLEKVMSR